MNEQLPSSHAIASILVLIAQLEQYALAQSQLTKFLQNYRKSTNAPMAVAAPETSSSATVAVESGLAAPTPAQDQPADQQPITSQVLAEIFRHTAGTSTNQSTAVVLSPGFMPPQPAAPRSSSATYTDH